MLPIFKYENTFFLFLTMLKIKHSALGMPGKHFARELHLKLCPIFYKMMVSVDWEVRIDWNVLGKLIGFLGFF